MNISKKTLFTGLEETGLSPAHINHCLHNGAKYDYSYFGKRVSRGTVTFNTKIGEISARFREQNGWATEMELIID